MIAALLVKSPYGGYKFVRRWWYLGLLPWLGVTYQVFAPVDVYWNVDRLAVYGGMFQRSMIELADLEDVQLLATLPAPTRRVSGYAFAGRKRGTFELPDRGTIDLFLDGSSPPYVLLRARGNARSIAVNARDPEASRQLFERLQLEVAQRRAAANHFAARSRP
jgi:hypothetical protein